MSHGVRLAPALNRQPVPDNAMIVLQDLSRPFAPPTTGEPIEDILPRCPTCGVQHFHKVYHLQLVAGTVIVSPTIWAKFQKMPDNGGFVWVNDVEAPPAQGISPGKAPEIISKHEVPILSPVKERSKLAVALRPQSKTARAGEGGN